MQMRSTGGGIGRQNDGLPDDVGARGVVGGNALRFFILVIVQCLFASKLAPTKSGWGMGMQAVEAGWRL